MKLKTHFLLFVVLIIATTSQNSIAQTNTLNSKTIEAKEISREYYQLKTYTFDTEEQVNGVDKYLKEAYLPALKRLNISNVGVFKLRPNATDTIKKIFVLIPFSSLAQFEALESKLAKDQNYLKAGSNYITASFDQPNYKRIESMLLKAFKDMPFMKASTLDGPRKDRIYELRSYESATEAYFKNKLEMFNEGGEIKLFKRLEFNAVFFGEVISGPKMPNLIYLTTYSNQQTHDAHWKAFSDSPEWKNISTMPKYQNNISHIDATFLYPTEYSDY